MKQINNYIQEKLKINKSVVNKNLYKLFPKYKDELVKMVENEIYQNGDDCDLNHIDVSKITDMSHLFYYLDFYGDISSWDVSNVKDMRSMFRGSCFSGDISSWDVSNVIYMNNMFRDSDFNSDISKWNVSNVKDMDRMFQNNKYFNQDISNWKINHNCNTYEMFISCPIKNEYIPKLPKN